MKLQFLSLDHHNCAKLRFVGIVSQSAILGVIVFRLGVLDLLMGENLHLSFS